MTDQPDSVHDAGRHDALEAALAWAEAPVTGRNHAATLAAAVRDLREQIVALNRECSRAIAENTDAYVAENIKLEAELAALKARTFDADKAIAGIMGRATAASGTAVFVDPVILRSILDGAWAAREGA